MRIVFFIFCRLKFHYSQAGTAVIHVTVAELERHLSAFAALTVEVIEIVPRQLFECTCACTMQNGHFTGTHHHGIIHIGDELLQGLVGTTAAQVQRTIERDGAFVRDVHA